MDKKLLASIVLASAGLAMLIAGSVMLGIGISKSNQKAPAAPPCNCPSCPSVDPSAVFTSSYTQSIQYTAKLGDSNSTAFKKAAAQLANNITVLLNSPAQTKASVLDASGRTTTVTINSFTPTITGVGVNFYATILYSSNGASSSDVQKQISTTYPTSANVNPTTSCTSMVLPPGEPTPAPPVTVATQVPPVTQATHSAQPTTMVVTETSSGTTVSNASMNSLTTMAQPQTTQSFSTKAAPLTTLPTGVGCDAYEQSLLVVFLIDVAVPNIGTLSDKLTTLQTFLNNYDDYLGLHDRSNWGGVQFQFVTYNGVQQAFSSACSDDNCWHTEVDALLPGLVNPSNNQAHTLSYGLNEAARINPPNTQAWSIIVISDGFDITDTQTSYYADRLKTRNAQISAFMGTTNQVALAEMENVVTNAGLLYTLPSMDWLNDASVCGTMASWSCLAPYPATTRQTVPFTQPSVRTTKPLSTKSPLDKPTLVQPCDQYDDVIIIVHSSSVSNLNTTKKFLSQLVVPALSGPLTMKSTYGSNINFGVIDYFGEIAQNDAAVYYQLPNSEIAQAINSIKFIDTKGPNALSSAYAAANQQLSLSRKLATPTILVVTDDVDAIDTDSALLYRTYLPSNSYVFGLRIGAPGDLPIPGQDDYVIVDIAQLDPANQDSIVLANTVANGLCRYIPVTTTPFPTTPSPKPTPGPIPHVKARNVWPDVAILIDASQQNASFFETQRMFLRKTFLNEFQISDKYSRFTVATYNNATNIICQFSDIINYWDLEPCLGSKISYTNVVNSAVKTRDINKALSYLMTEVYMKNFTGYKPLKENYLFVLTNGQSSNLFYNSAMAFKNMGVRLIGIDISQSNGMTSNDLSGFGPDSYKVPNWLNPTVNDQLSQSIIVQTTTKPRPMLSSLFSDFYFIVDTSNSLNLDLTNVKQFVTKFFDQLTVSPHRSRISIVPFSDTVMNPLQLTDDANTVSDYLNNWQTRLPGANVSNIGEAISFVNSELELSGGRTTNVIYLVGAEITNGDASSSEIWSDAGLPSYVINYNSVDYAGFLTGDPSFVYKVQGSENLQNWVESKFPVDVRGRNPMNQFFNRLLDVQEASDTANFPTKEVIADIIVFLDETGLTEDDFASVKQYLLNITSQFTISRKDTQIALQTFSGSTIPSAPIHFYESVSNDAITQKIDNLVLTPSTGKTANLAGAVNQALYYFLQPQYGWRDDATTYTLIITNANSFTNPVNLSTVQNDLKAVSQVFGYTLNNEFDLIVYDFINTNYYQLLQNPEQLNSETVPGNQLVQSLTDMYKEYVFPPPVPLSHVSADFVFLIDNTNATTSQQQIRSFLLKITNTMAPFTYDKSRMAVINYNSQGVIQSTSWTLTTYQYTKDLQAAIGALKITPDDKAPDLEAAIGYFSTLPSLFGVGVWNPVFVTGIFSSPTIKSDLPRTIMDSINLQYYTFALQNNGNRDAFDYLPQFLGSDYTEDFVYTSDLSTYDTTQENAFYPYNTYIQSEYQAWQNSYYYFNGN